MAVLRFSVLVFICVAFAHCKNAINITDHIDKNAPLTLTINKRDSLTGLTTSNRFTIQINSEKYKKVIDWCKKNSNGWQSTPASFAPDIGLTQSNFRLLYFTQSDGVVIGFDAKQYSKQIKKGELDFLIE
jgi:hypothetical protein